MPTDVADFHFYTTRDFFDKLTELIHAAPKGQRVTVATMAYIPSDPGVHRVLEELRVAAVRGVRVQLLVDAQPFLIARSRWLGDTTPGPLFYNSGLPLKLRGQFKQAYESLERLQDAGASFAIINQPGRRFSNPIGGRSHVKFAVVGDEVLVGGCNLDTSSHLDVMVGWNDPATAHWLMELAEGVVSHGSVREASGGDDATFDLNARTKLILDAGVRGQSGIMSEALTLIDQAKDYIVLCSQYFPNDVTSRHLMAAHERGVRVKIFYNHPSQFGRPFNALHFGVIQKARRSLPKSFFENAQRRGYLHAKVLATERAVMVGSHNFVIIGVKLGTAELEIMSTDAQFKQEVFEVLARQIQGFVKVD